MRLTDTTPSYNYNQLKKIRDMNKIIIKIYVYSLRENEAIIPLLITHNNPEVCKILKNKKHYVICKDMFPIEERAA